MPKSKWPEIQEQLYAIEGWYRAGALDTEVAERLGISESTLNAYKAKQPELSDAISRGKGMADDEVVASLFRRATGFSAVQAKSYKCRRVYYDDNGNRCEEEEVKTAEETSYFPPDVTAQAIWLNNRRPKDWRRNAGKESLDERRFSHEQERDAKRDW